MGAPGRLAALEILKDWKRGRSREEPRRRSIIGRRPQRPRDGGPCSRKGGLQAARARAPRRRRAAPPSPRSSIPGFSASTVAHLPDPLRASVAEDARPQQARAQRSSRLEPRVFAPAARRPRRRACGATPSARPPSIRAALRRGRRSATRRSTARCPPWPRSSSRPRPSTPPDVDRPAEGADVRAAGLGLGFRGLGREDAQRLLRWGPMAVADFAAEWFETEALRAVVCGARHHGDLAPAPGRRERRPTCSCRPRRGGGNGAGTAVLREGRPRRAARGTLADAARGFGAEIRTGAEVERIATKDGRVTGVVPRGRRGDRRPGPWPPAPTPSARSSGCSTPPCSTPRTCARIRNYRQRGHGLQGEPRPVRACRAFTAARRGRRGPPARPHPHRPRASTTSSAPSTTPSTAASRARP